VGVTDGYVRQQTNQNNQSVKLPGVTDTIASGLSEVLARPWLMAIPMLLDLYYWVGWRFLPTALTNRISEAVSDSSIDNKKSWLEWLTGMGKADLSGIVGLLVPSVLIGVDRDQAFEVWSRPVIAPDSAWLVLVIALGFFLIASLCFMAFVVPLADVVTKRARPWSQMPLAIVKAWARVLALQALLAGAFLLVFGPAAFVTAIFALAGVDLSGLLLAVGVMSVIAVYIFLWFAFVAIAVAEVGPFRAVYLSFNVVRRFFSQTMGLIVASLLIGSGLPALWEQLMESPPGLLIAVIANAFFAVGVSIATLIFFTDRLRALHFDVATPAFSIARRSTV
jgi:hypothetical protein